MSDYHSIDGASLNRPDDYTGYWEAYWPNGRLKYRGHFVNGVEVGQQVCYWEDGTIAQLGWRDVDSWERPNIPPKEPNVRDEAPADQLHSGAHTDDSENELDTPDDSDYLTLSECIQIDLCGLRAVIDAIGCDNSAIPELVNACSRLEALLAAIGRGEITQEQANVEYRQIEWDKNR